MTETIYTRADYMEKRVSHQDYYAAIAREAGISYADSEKLPEIIAALEAGDEHLNTIPLRWWDARAVYGVYVMDAALKKFPGEIYSLSTSVCAHKAAARAAALAAKEA